MQPRLELLLQVHNELCRSAGLPETTRPYSIASRLESIQKSIMEEVTKGASPASPAKTEDDNIPF